MATTAKGRQRFLWGLIGAGVLAMIFLYFIGYLYIQFLIVIWSVVFVLAFVVYDRDAHQQQGSRGGNATKKSQLSAALAEIDGKISETDREDVKKLLKRQRDQVEQDIRRLDWTMREQELANAEMISASVGLKPLPREPSWRERRREENLQSSHLRARLKDAAEVVSEEKGDAAKEELKALANDLKAHYDVMKSKKPGPAILDDYRMSWGVLTALSKGTSPDFDFGKYSSRRFRNLLRKLVEAAEASGLAS